MKKRNKYFKEKRIHEVIELGYDDYITMFEEGYSDAEISNEFGINENYIKAVREEYENDY